MSEKFGLDWKEYELQRISDLLLTEQIKNEIKKANNK